MAMPKAESGPVQRFTCEVGQEFEIEIKTHSESRTFRVVLKEWEVESRRKHFEFFAGHEVYIGTDATLTVEFEVLGIRL